MFIEVLMQLITVVYTEEEWFFTDLYKLLLCQLNNDMKQLLYIINIKYIEQIEDSAVIYKIKSIYSL